MVNIKTTFKTISHTQFTPPKEVNDVTEKIEEHPKEQIKKQKKKLEEELPFCTSAPSAEHARGMEVDEPCDDSRTGDYGEDNPGK